MSKATRIIAFSSYKNMNQTQNLVIYLLRLSAKVTSTRPFGQLFREINHKEQHVFVSRTWLLITALFHVPHCSEHRNVR